MVVYGQRGSIRARVGVFVQSGCNLGKWLFSRKVVVFEKKRLYSGKVVVFGEKLLY